MEYDGGPDPSLFREPWGKADGKRWRMVPFRCLLIVVPSDETTKHLFPDGLGSTYLHSQTKFKELWNPIFNRLTKN